MEQKSRKGKQSKIKCRTERNQEITKTRKIKRNIEVDRRRNIYDNLDSFFSDFEDISDVISCLRQSRFASGDVVDGGKCSVRLLETLRDVLIDGKEQMLASISLTADNDFRSFQNDSPIITHCIDENLFNLLSGMIDVNTVDVIVDILLMVLKFASFNQRKLISESNIQTSFLVFVCNTSDISLKTKLIDCLSLVAIVNDQFRSTLYSIFPSFTQNLVLSHQMDMQTWNYWRSVSYFLFTLTQRINRASLDEKQLIDLFAVSGVLLQLNDEKITVNSIMSFKWLIYTESEVIFKLTIETKLIESLTKFLESNEDFLKEAVTFIMLFLSSHCAMFVGVLQRCNFIAFVPKLMKICTGDVKLNTLSILMNIYKEDNSAIDQIDLEAIPAILEAITFGDIKTRNMATEFISILVLNEHIHLICELLKHDVLHFLIVHLSSVDQNMLFVVINTYERLLILEAKHRIPFQVAKECANSFVVDKLNELFLDERTNGTIAAKIGEILEKYIDELDELMEDNFIVDQ
ncbi:hypothetical protein B4U80_12984 [Leptotrombidium deliense]|uniref:Uncharacterized protein n=1 Tax=Leptotrombidium deliense TaxID=299467 RepID=A0A443SFU1_9ACAR|nr:hypothetical protein B4U80_12984 [Leptotrombidium deliense]